MINLMKRVMDNSLKLSAALFVFACIGFIAACNDAHAASANNVVQAHNWSAKSGTVNVETGLAPDGNSIGGITAGSWTRYDNVDFGDGTFNTFMATVAVPNASAGKPIQIRLDTATGTLIGTLTVAGTGSFSDFKEEYAPISSVTGIHSVYLVFPQAAPANINWFVFGKDPTQETPAQKQQRMQWFTDARFGQFLHWGAYSKLKGHWASCLDAEWIKKQCNISDSDYLANAVQPFNPINFNAATWISTIKNGGAKYLVVTSKHHDGFSMFNTNVKDFTGYDIVHASAYAQDPLLALSQQAKSQGIKFGVYYSIWDWHNVNVKTDTPTSAQKTLYLSEMKEQLREIIQNYSPDLLWFDGEWNDWWTAQDGQTLYKYLRTLKYDIIINDRVGKRGGTDGDYATPEQSIPSGTLSRIFESCITMNDHWGYVDYESNYKTAKTMISNLAQNASNGGNLLLNVGPTDLGQYPQLAIDRMNTIGQWLNVNGASIYGTTASVIGTIDNGYSTTKSGKVYLHIINWPANNKITVPAVDNTVNKVYMMTNSASNLTYSVSAGQMTINLPAGATDPNDSVVVIEVNGQPVRTYSPPNTFVNDSLLSYFGSWTTGANRGYGDYQNDVHSTTTNGDSVEYTFTGTGVSYITEKNSDQGNVDVYVDNVFQQTVNTSNPSRLAQQTVYNKTGLSQGQHKIKLVKKDGNYMLIDAVSIETKVNNSDATIFYQGAWSGSGNRGYGDYMDDVQYSTTNGNDVTFSFYGTGISYITEKNSDQGNVDVYLDGVFKQTVSANNASRLAQQTVYSVSNLPAGLHTIKLVKTSGTYMLVDAFLIK
ncbi:alpha-L-fucosidase [Cohnella yongneupensis]|uniref:alpha-L-fucosidase n=1 Tax=Cohnella yongneupensis TaxID=425006 RepID=A0ABW0QUU3_9BACL